MKDHDHQNRKSMIGRNVILRFEFILYKIEGSRDQGNLMNEKSTLNAIWIMFHNLADLLLGPPILGLLDNKVINK
jgi:hypothetical protein